MANRNSNKRLQMSAVYLADAKRIRTNDTEIYEANYVMVLRVRIEVSIMN